MWVRSVSTVTLSFSAISLLSATVEAGEGLAVKIHLHVQCTADELDDLAPKLRTLLREFSNP